VTIQPRRGAFVVDVSISDLDELYSARQLIEGETLYHAVPHLTEADFADLQVMIEAMRGSTDAHDISTYIATNRQFHLRLYSALGNQQLLGVIQMLWERSELYRYRYMFMTRDTERVHQEHQGILDACRRRDAALAKARAQEHINRTLHGLHDQLKGDLNTHRSPDDR
jgi:DNA-binding GntR family transcriptional regulator